jgi:hypothetical protein
MRTPVHSKDLIVNGVTFQAPLKYSEGQIISANEAAALNALFHKDLADGMKRLVKKEEELSDETLARLRAQFDEACSKHDFAPKAPSNSFDPIMIEAIKIATPKVREFLVKKGIDVEHLGKEKFEEIILKAIEQRPEIKTEARRRIDAMRGIAEKVFDIPQPEAVNA